MADETEGMGGDKGGQRGNVVIKKYQSVPLEPNFLAPPLTEGKGAAGDSSSGKRKRVENDKLTDDNAVYFDSSSSDEDNDLLNDDTNNIFVKTFTGKMISLEVKRSDTIGNVKVKIQAAENISPEKQALIFNNNVLGDMITLDQVRMKKDSALTLMRKSGGLVRIFVKNYEGTITALKVKL
ncbi:putative ubiquitin [Tanacetum coccineum]